MGSASTTSAKTPDLIVADSLKRIATLATLPEVTTRIIKTVEDPRSSASQLHKIVSYDPALVTRILKVVNSSFYGLPGQIGSVERAIVLLGTNAVKNIAVAASLGQLFRGVKLYDKFTARDLWQHCVAVAVAARAIAMTMRLSIAEEAFLSGMIHDIGLLVSMQTAPEMLQRVCADVAKNEVDFCAAERALSGVDHQMLGAGLAAMWKFPKNCQLVASHHHQPQNLPTETRQLAAIVFTADTICCQAEIGFNLTALRQDSHSNAGGDGFVPSDVIDAVRQNLPALLESSSSMAA